MRFLLLLYFAVLFLLSLWIFAIEFGSDGGIMPDDAAAEESAPAHAGGESHDVALPSSERQTTDASAEAAHAEAKQLLVYQHGEQRGEQDGGEADQFEQPYLQLGYKSVHDAVRDCEMRFMQRIHLPIYTPSLSFTHQLGKCHMNFDEQDGLEINYLHELIPAQRYLILVRPAKHRVEFPESRISETYRLPDESLALLSETPEGGYYVLSFEQDNLQYMLVVSRHIGLAPEELVKAAQSLQAYRQDAVW